MSKTTTTTTTTNDNTISSNEEISKLLLIARNKTDEQLTSLTECSESTKSFVRAHTNTAFSFCVNHMKISELYQELMSVVANPLIKPFQRLNSCYIEFYAAFGVNVGVFSAIVHSQQYVLPNCVSDTTQFRELCSIISEIISVRRIDTAPLIKNLIDATQEVSNSIITLQAAVNRYNHQSDKTLLDSYDKIGSIRKRIEDVLLEIQQGESQKVFIEQNSNNTNRIIDYLKKRIEIINQQIEVVEKDIQSYCKPTRTPAFFTFFIPVTDLQLLQQRKSDLLNERGKLENQIQSLFKDSKKSVSSSPLLDLSEKKQILQDLKKLLKQAEEQHQQSLTDYFTFAFSLSNVRTEEAKKMAHLLNLLNVITLRVITILNEIDTTASIISKAITNEKLSPANIIGSISSIFQFSVMAEILKTDHLSICSSSQFDKSYTSFTNQRDDIQLLAIEKAEPSFVAIQDNITAEKKKRLGNAGWD